MYVKTFPEQVHVPCVQAGCSLQSARPSGVTVPLFPLPECLQSPMNFAAQLDGGAAPAGAAQVNNSETAITRLILIPPNKIRVPEHAQHQRL